jgi:hypothetical protein
VLKDTQPKVVLVRRATRIDELIARHNTMSQARFVIESRGGDFSDYLAEHQHYYQQLSVVKEIIGQLALMNEVERRYLPNYVFGPHDVIVVFGQDGLVANTLKYLDQQSLVGVNPDPGRWDGVLLPFSSAELAGILPETLAGTRNIREVTMACATLGDGQVIHAVNDLFIGPKSHTSARYQIIYRGRQEHQSSSGVIISTGLGSTGWLQSLMVGARAIRDATVISRETKIRYGPTSFAWDEKRLTFTVREPFPSKNSSVEIVFGWIEGKEKIRLVSQMPENGVIFSDGIEQDFVVFNSGSVATIGIADKRGHLVV